MSDNTAIPAPPQGGPPGVDLRLLQANERTLLAWVRTGLALMAFGFVVARLGVFLRSLEAQPSHDGVRPSMLIGAALVAIGTASNVAAAIRYVRVRKALLRSEPILPSASAGVLLALGVALVGAILTVYVFTL